MNIKRCARVSVFNFLHRTVATIAPTGGINCNTPAAKHSFSFDRTRNNIKYINTDAYAHTITAKAMSDAYAAPATPVAFSASCITASSAPAIVSPAHTPPNARIYAVFAHSTISAINSKSEKNAKPIFK